MNDALIGYWTFNQTSGLHIPEVSNYSTNMTAFINGTATWGAGKIGNALYFDGSTTANTSQKIPIKGNANSSFFCWTNVSDGTSTMAFGGWGEQINYKKRFFGIERGANDRLYFSGHNLDVGAPIKFEEFDNWSFVGYTIQNMTPFFSQVNGTANWTAQIKMYHNDTMIYAGNFSLMNTSEGNFTFGGGILSWDFTGWLDECFLMSDCIIPSNVSDIYNSRKGSTYEKQDLQNPQITINFPKNVTYNGSDTKFDFNITATDDIALDTCLYTLNDTETNYTLISTSATMFNHTNLSMSIGEHTVIYFCNDTTNNYNNTEWIDFNILAKNPPLTINKPTGTLTTLTVDINITTRDDLSTISYCNYTILRGASVEVANTEIKNCHNATTTVSGDANYHFIASVNCTMNFLNTTNSSFTVSTNGNGNGGGGGGGAPPEKKEPELPELPISICNPFKEEFLIAWEEAKEIENLWERFKYFWNAFWNLTLCKSASSIVPI